MVTPGLPPQDGKQYETDFRSLWLLPQCLWRTDQKNHKNQDKEGALDFHVKNSQGDKEGRPRLLPWLKALQSLSNLLCPSVGFTG